MLQLYQLIKRAAKDHELTFSAELLAALPKSEREYEENINFEELEAAEPENRKSLGSKKSALSHEDVVE